MEKMEGSVLLMPELSLNILDMAENSFTAGASLIEIIINEKLSRDILSITVKDNGKGMDSSTIQKVTDPFFSGKKGKGWGLGIPFLKQTADLCNGNLTISSDPGSGTAITVTVQLSHIDRPPLGALSDTIVTLAAGHSDKDISLIIQRDEKIYEFKTQVIRKELEGARLSDPDILKFIETDINRGIKDLELVP